jgi:hypothetical protein
VTFHAEFGKVPDYFAGATVVVALIAYRRERRSERKAAEDRYKAEKFQRLREAAPVAARLALEDDSGQESALGKVVARVWNASGQNVQNVRMVARHAVLGERAWQW